jgi:hypothetical protein
VAIIEGPPGSGADMAALTWELVEAFGVLAHASAKHCTREQATNLLKLSEGFHRRALLFDREELADRLEQASVRLATAAH